MKFRCYTQLVILLSCWLPTLISAVWAQPVVPTSEDPEPIPLITAIYITGNKHTKKHVILREMKSKVGEPLDSELIEGDQKRILNMGLFSNVQIQGVPSDKGVDLYVMVSETWYFYPYPIFFLNDRDWSKISYGLGVLHYNFRGRREVISASGWLGYDPAIKLDYSNPWLFGKAQLFARLGFFAKLERNRFLATAGQEVDEKRLGGNFALGKRFGYHTYLSLTLGYTRLRYDSNQSITSDQPLTLTPCTGDTSRCEDHLPSIGLSLAYDTRDFHEYPRAGNYVSLWFRRTGIAQEYVHYWRYGLDLRRYQPIIGGVSLGLRVMTNLSADTIPIYDLVYLGFENRVRGHFFTQRSGENLVLTSAELRIPLVPLKFEPLSNFPLIGDMLDKTFSRFVRYYKSGLNLALFVDYGNVWYQSDNFDRNNGLLGFGAGLHVHVPIINVLRLEWAMDDKFRSQYIIDYAVSF